MENNNGLFEEIAEYIVKSVQKNSILSGFQYIVDYTEIGTKFEVEITETNKEKIIDALQEREEVADVQKDPIGFDVVLFTAYAPNYSEDNLL